MPTESIRVSGHVPAAPETVFNAWLDPREHGAMTSSGATAEPYVGGRFTAGDGYISGTTLEIEPSRRILQSWRTTEFPDGHADSLLEVLFDAEEGGTRVTFVHTEIPEGHGARLEQGWKDFYLSPMRSYFAGEVPSPPTMAPAPSRAAAPRAKKATARKPARKKKAAKKAPARRAAKRKPARKAARRKVAKKRPTKRAARRAPARRRPAKKRATKRVAARRATKKRAGGARRKK